MPPAPRRSNEPGVPWTGSNPTDRILKHLAEIGAGRCSITEETVVREPDSEMRQVLLGLLVLSEDLNYASEQRSESETALRLVASERERLLEDRRRAVAARDEFIAVSPAVNLHTVNRFERLVATPYESFELRVIVQREVFPHLYVRRRRVEDIGRHVLP